MFGMVVTSMLIVLVPLVDVPPQKARRTQGGHHDYQPPGLV
jgi:hypothetical protein